jgi:hypothetical protein
LLSLSHQGFSREFDSNFSKKIILTGILMILPGTFSNYDIANFFYEKSGHPAPT